MKTVATFKASLLASWLRTKKKTWWLVDGDARLEESLAFPCEAEELAKQLELTPNRIAKAIQPTANEIAELGTVEDAKDIEKVAVDIDTYGGRGLYLCWDDMTEDCEWLIVDKTDYVNENLQDEDLAASEDGDATR